VHPVGSFCANISRCTVNKTSKKIIKVYIKLKYFVEINAYSFLNKAETHAEFWTSGRIINAHKTCKSVLLSDSRMLELCIWFPFVIRNLLVARNRIGTSIV
jgi:hypothetical protein